MEEGPCCGPERTWSFAFAPIIFAGNSKAGSPLCGQCAKLATPLNFGPCVFMLASASGNCGEWEEGDHGELVANMNLFSGMGVSFFLLLGTGGQCADTHDVHLARYG